MKKRWIELEKYIIDANEIVAFSHGDKDEDFVARFELGIFLKSGFERYFYFKTVEDRKDVMDFILDSKLISHPYEL